MKLNLKAAAISVLSVLAAAPVVLAANVASAQPATGMEGSYLGGGLSVGVNQPDDDVDLGGNVQARVDVPEAPVSVRGSVLFNGDGTNIMPLVTGDIPVAPNTNVYLGGGYSFATGNGVAPLGDEDGAVLTAGVEGAVQERIALYSDVKVGIDTFSANNDPAVAVQAGVAYRF